MSRKTYTCEKCAKVFKQKGHFTNHQEKKIDCASQTNLDRIIEEKVEQKVNERVQEVVRSIVQPTITTDKSNLQSFFENLHNLLWNKVGLNPENALKHMTLFFAYRMMELQADTLQLPQECRWSYISSLTSAEKMDQAIKKGIVEFRKNPVTKPFFFVHDVKKVDVMHDIVLLINRISTEDLQRADTLGEIFEYMLGRGMGTMADEGQYFTNRIICKLAFTLAYRIKGSVRRQDGTLCTFADWFCGTGGFTTEYIKGVKANVDHVDWKRDKMAIYSQDQNESSVTTTLLNALITTGEPFSPTTIRMTNSFSDPIIRGSSAPFPELTIDYCFMNPPYGGDKSKGKAYKFAYTKGKGLDKQFLVNEDIRTIGIEDDDKVSAGVQLGMATLAEGGVCCIVLPQGFFFGASKKCVELRKKLAEEYKIWYIVEIASGAFLNTGTKTSMMVFQKGVGATETVSFIGLDETVLIEVSLEELRTKHYSFNYKQYLPQSSVEIDGFEMVKLGDIAKKLTTRGKHSAKDTIENGKYSLFSSSINEIYALNTFDYSETCCIINSTNASGNAVVNLGINFSVTSDTFVFKCENDVTTTYAQIYLSNNIQLVKETFQGANHKHPTWDRLSEIQIPLPSLVKQQEIVDSIDGFTQLAHTEEQSLKLLEKSVMFEVKWMGQGKEQVKLGDVCEWQMGKRIVKDKVELGTVPVYGGGGITFYTNSSNRNGINCKISREGMSEANCVIMIHGDYHQNSQGMTVISKDLKKTINPYIWYWLVINKDKVYDCGHGTAQKAISMTMLNELQIPLPSLAEQQTLQSDFDEIRHKHAKIAEYKAKAQEAIRRLIPGANTETVIQEDKSSEAHSSQCQVKEDGTGCTCRVQIVIENDELDSETEYVTESNSSFSTTASSSNAYNASTVSSSSLSSSAK